MPLWRPNGDNGFQATERRHSIVWLSPDGGDARDRLGAPSTSDSPVLGDGEEDAWLLAVAGYARAGGVR